MTTQLTMTEKTEKVPRLPLTPRELEVLILMANGKSNKEIATVLNISENTAKFHVNSILTKTKTNTRLDATVYCLKVGIIKLDALMIGVPIVKFMTADATKAMTITKENIINDIVKVINTTDFKDIKKEVTDVINTYIST